MLRSWLSACLDVRLPQPLATAAWYGHCMQLPPQYLHVSTKRGMRRCSLPSAAGFVATRLTSAGGRILAMPRLQRESNIHASSAMPAASGTPSHVLQRPASERPRRLQQMRCMRMCGTAALSPLQPRPAAARRTRCARWARLQKRSQRCAARSASHRQLQWPPLRPNALLRSTNRHPRVVRPRARSSSRPRQAEWRSSSLRRPTPEIQTKRLAHVSSLVPPATPSAAGSPSGLKSRSSRPRHALQRLWRCSPHAAPTPPCRHKRRTWVRNQGTIEPRRLLQTLRNRSGAPAAQRAVARSGTSPKPAAAYKWQRRVLHAHRPACRTHRRQRPPRPGLISICKAIARKTAGLLCMPRRPARKKTTACLRRRRSLQAPQCSRVRARSLIRFRRTCGRRGTLCQMPLQRLSVQDQP